MSTKQSRTGLYEQLNTMRIAFWHPFGPHGGESAEEILGRKQKECADVGETFWTFRAAGKDTVEFWRKEIRKHGGVVSALCIFRDSNKDPSKAGKNSNFLDATFWQSDKKREDTREQIQPKIHATIAPGLFASAFRVAAVEILEPHAFLRRQGKLLRLGSARALGRGQKLVQFVDGVGDSRPWKGEVAAILRLKGPWIVWVGRGNSSNRNG